MTITLSEIFSHYQGKKDELIPILQHVQREYGYLSRDNMLAIAQFTNIAESEVYGVATFYAQFRFTPMGEKLVMVCRGTSCHVRGAPKILETVENTLNIKAGETTPDRKYTLETVACIGCCGLAPCIMIDNKVEAKLTPTKVKEFFHKENNNKQKS